MKQFFGTKMSLPSHPPEAAEKNVIIKGYIDDLTRENYKASPTGELDGKCEFFYEKIVYIYEL